MNNVQKSLEKNQHVTKLVSYEDCTKLCEKKKTKIPANLYTFSKHMDYSTVGVFSEQLGEELGQGFHTASREIISLPQSSTRSHCRFT